MSRSREFVAAVDQAGGAMTWNGNPAIRSALVAVADRVATPTLLLVAENDRTTASITTVGAALQKRGVPHRVVIYPPFASRQTFRADAPGHQVFGPQDVSVWQDDVLEFLGRYLSQGGSKP